MKMDAMQRKKMWKVAFCHFGLTALIMVIGFFSAFSTSPGNWETWQRFQNSYIWRAALNNFLGHIFYFVQPPFWLLANFSRSNLLFWVGLGSTPLWSICFGWLFVKLDNWLNHFPILGRKVF